MVNLVHRIFIGLPLTSFLNSTFLYYSSLTKINLFEMFFNGQIGRDCLDLVGYWADLSLGYPMHKRSLEKTVRSYGFNQ
jgi:hypothetical protein